MLVLEAIRSWMKDPFGKKETTQRHTDIQRELQLVRGQVEQRTRDLSTHPYRALHRDFRQKGKKADVQLHE